MAQAQTSDILDNEGKEKKDKRVVFFFYFNAWSWQKDHKCCNGFHGPFQSIFMTLISLSHVKKGQDIFVSKIFWYIWLAQIGGTNVRRCCHLKGLFLNNYDHVQWHSPWWKCLLSSNIFHIFCKERVSSDRGVFFVGFVDSVFWRTFCQNGLFLCVFSKYFSGLNFFRHSDSEFSSNQMFLPEYERIHAL